MKEKKCKADRWKRKPLTIDDRQYILKMNDNGLGIREIARKLGRNHSIVSRFLSNIPYSPYLSKLSSNELAWEMHVRAKQNRSKSRSKQRLKSKFIRDYVESKLELGWSPELIAGRLSIDHPGLKTNHESIYQWIYKEKRELIKFLFHHGEKKYKKRASKKANRSKQAAVPKTSIEERPEIVNSRKDFGHWEGDTIVSRQSKAGIFNLVERGTRHIILRKVDNLTAESGALAVIESLEKLPPELRKTATFDNGPENSDFTRMEKKLGIKTYFCHPYTASERGTVENRNKFLRKYFPKKTNFADITNEDIQRVQDIHNHRPMKCLKFKTPHESLWELLRLTDFGQVQQVN